MSAPKNGSNGTDPKANPDNGRDANGKFAKGNAGGPGNPYNRRVAELRTMHVGPEHIVVNAEVVVVGSADALVVVEHVDRAVSDLDRRLDVTVEPQREAKPGSDVASADRPAAPAEGLDPDQGSS